MQINSTNGNHDVASFVIHKVVGIWSKISDYNKQTSMTQSDDITNSFIIIKAS